MKKYQGISVSPGLVLGAGQPCSSGRPICSTAASTAPEKEELVLEEAVPHRAERAGLHGRALGRQRAGHFHLPEHASGRTTPLWARSALTYRPAPARPEAMNRVGQRYADKLLAMTDNAYLQLRNVDILDVTQRVVNILAGRPRVLLTLDHPVILAADKLMPSDLFSIPSGMILGIITSEGQQPQPRGHYCPGKGHPQHHPGGAGLPGRLRRPDRGAGCRHRLLHPGPRRPTPASRPSPASAPASRRRRTCWKRPSAPCPARTRGRRRLRAAGPTALAPRTSAAPSSWGPRGVGAAAQRLPDPGRQRLRRAGAVLLLRRLHRGGGGQAHHRPHLRFRGRTAPSPTSTGGTKSAHLGMRGIRSSLRQPRRFENQIRALLRAGTIGPLRIVFPMVTSVVDWDDAMQQWWATAAATWKNGACPTKRTCPSGSCSASRRPA